MTRARFDPDGQTSFNTALAALALDRSRPLEAQLIVALRAMILDGVAAPGAALPSQRALAGELGVSRQLVASAYDQLHAEGVVETRLRSGVRVARDLPAAPAPEAEPTPVPSTTPSPPPAPSPTPAPPAPFDAGLPDPALFPHGAWARAMARGWRASGPALAGRPAPGGWPPLRAAIARHLRDWRGIEAAPEQVFVLSGALEAVRLLSDALPLGAALIESPGHPPLARECAALGREVRALRAVAGGFDPAALPDAAALLIATPSRQYPLGGSMPLARRLALMDWSARSGALVVEDDYDSEFRFQGQPLPALASLRAEPGAAYLGSFSKSLSPALRLGFLVAPPALVADFATALRLRGPQAGIAAQPALAAYLDSGGFAAHLRRTRRIYRRRRAALAEALAREGRGVLKLSPDDCGLHAIAWLTGRARSLGESRASLAARAAGLTARPLGALRWDGASGRAGLILGFAAFDEKTIAAAAARLVGALRAAIEETGKESQP